MRAKKKKTKAQAKADKAFIEKIASLGLNFGAGSDGPPTCADCGGIKVEVIPVYTLRRPKSAGEEQSFSA